MITIYVILDKSLRILFISQRHYDLHIFKDNPKLKSTTPITNSVHLMEKKTSNLVRKIKIHATIKKKDQQICDISI